MKKTLLILAFAALALSWAVAIAQPPQPAQPQMTPAEMITFQIANELGQLRIENTTLRVNLDAARAALAQAQALIKELESKLAPTTAKPAK